MRKYGLNITKERILTLTIIAIGYFLITANQVFMNPPITQSGYIEYEYTTPINQTANQTVIKESLTSTNWALIQNFTHFRNYNYFQIPRFDYDFVVFNLTLESISGEMEVHFRVHIGGDDPEIFQTITNRTTLTLETDLAYVKNKTDYWVLDVVPHVSPIEEFTIHCLEVWAYSNIPLCPITVDIRSTDNVSLFDNSLFEKLASGQPVLELSRENTSNRGASLYQHTANNTYYLRPIKLVGYVEWYLIAGRSDIEVDFGENETVYWIINLKSVRIDLSIDVDYPIYRINCISRSDREIYDMYLTPSQMPASFYIPAFYTDFRISLAKLIDNRYSHYMDSLFQAESVLDVNGTTNIRIDVAFSHLLVFGHYPITHIIIFVLVMSLFLIIVARLFLYLQDKWIESKKRIVLDFRLFPIVLFCILAFAPWFFSTRVFTPNWTDDDVLIHSASLGPLPIMGIWTEGSPIVLAMPNQAIEWFFWSMILYWLPLLCCLLFLTTPSYRENDILMGLVLFGPAAFGFFWSSILPTITEGSATISFTGVIAFTIPISWLILCSLIRKYYVFGSNFNQLERDEQISKEIEMKPLTKDKSYTYDIFFSLQFYLFVFLTIFTPCLVGFYSSTHFTDRISFVSPIQVLLYLLPDFGYFTYQKLGALLVGIPYAIFTLFTLIWIWQWMNRQRSISWIFAGTAISFVSMLPGLAILGLYSGRSWTITWVPIPFVLVLELLYSLAVWLHEANEQGQRSRISCSARCKNLDISVLSSGE